MQISYIYSSCLGSEGSVKNQKAVIYGHCFLMHKASKLSVHVMFLIEFGPNLCHSGIYF